MSDDAVILKEPVEAVALPDYGRSHRHGRAKWRRERYDSSAEGVQRSDLVCPAHQSLNR
jgi:hypothetical protein